MMYATINVVEMAITLFVVGAVTAVLLLAVYDRWNRRK
jgi:hypothetical protein